MAWICCQIHNTIRVAITSYNLLFSPQHTVFYLPLHLATFIHDEVDKFVLTWWNCAAVKTRFHGVPMRRYFQAVLYRIQFSHKVKLPFSFFYLFFSLHVQSWWYCFQYVIRALSLLYTVYWIPVSACSIHKRTMVPCKLEWSDLYSVVKKSIPRHFWFMLEYQSLSVWLLMNWFTARAEIAGNLAFLKV